jgi:hypothetical protein
MDGTKSSTLALFSGVPHGSVPSPLFYLCLSIVCPNVFVIQNFNFMLMTYMNYARVDEDLEAIHRWSIENGLFLNPAKSLAI